MATMIAAKTVPVIMAAFVLSAPTKEKKKNYRITRTIND